MKYNKLHVLMFILTSIASIFLYVSSYANHHMFDFVLGLVNSVLAVYWFTRLQDKK